MTAAHAHSAASAAHRLDEPWWRKRHEKILEQRDPNIDRCLARGAARVPPAAPRRWLFLFLACLALSGCVKSTYAWGTYEDGLYTMYSSVDKDSPAKQIQALKTDIAKAAANGRRVPPGVHAHLGYQFFLLGDAKSARQEFLAEKTLFPESSVFIDGLLRRITKE